MEPTDSKMCAAHNAKNEFLCIDCNKLICLNCRYSHQKDHIQIIHLAEVSTNIITHMQQRLDIIKDIVHNEYNEIESMINEFHQDKENIYAMLKKLEQRIVTMLQDVSFALTKKLQVTDKKLYELQSTIGSVKSKYEQAVNDLDKLMDINRKKDYWQVYLTQEKLKTGDGVLSGIDFKEAAIKESVNRGQQTKSKLPDSLEVIPRDFSDMKMKAKKIMTITDFLYLKDITKDISKEISNFNKVLSNDINSMKQQHSVLNIKNNVETLIKKYEKKYIASWILNEKVGKTVELELLYKGKRDGFKIADFHSKCDGKSPTLTIIKVANDIFGGYTTQSWGNNIFGGIKDDPNGFTFSLTKKIKCTIRADMKKSKVPHMQNATAVFGTGEILISDRADENDDSYAIPGVNYIQPMTSDPEKFYTTTKNFKVIDIETYRVKF